MNKDLQKLLSIIIIVIIAIFLVNKILPYGKKLWGQIFPSSVKEGLMVQPSELVANAIANAMNTGNVTNELTDQNPTIQVGPVKESSPPSVKEGINLSYSGMTSEMNVMSCEHWKNNGGSCFTCHSTDKCYDSTGGGGSKECAICCPGGDNTGLVTTDPKWNITGTAQNSTTYCMPPALYSLPMSQGNQAHDTEYTCQNALFYPKDCTGGGGCTNPTTGPATDSNLTKNWWWCDAGAVVNQNRSDIPLTRLLAPRAIGGGPGQEGNPCGYGCMKCIKSGKMCGFIDAPLQFVSLTVENYPNSNTQNISLGGKVTAIYKVPANRNVKSKYPVG